MPNPRGFLEDHLQLIFDMRRRMEDQTKNQRTLNQRMDLLFDALSYVPKKTPCLTYEKRFLFTYDTMEA